MGLSGFLGYESEFRPTMHAASRHGTPSLTSLQKKALGEGNEDEGFLNDQDDCSGRPCTLFSVRRKGLVSSPPQWLSFNATMSVVYSTKSI